MSDVRSDDQDIDALMGSVVGSNGQIVEFPPAKVRVPKPSKVAKVAELSAELAEELEANDVKPEIDPRKTGGITSLAAYGPCGPQVKDSRIGAPADALLNGVVNVIDCSAEAIAAFEAVTWA